MSEIPEWAKRWLHHDKAEREARRGRDLALDLRCPMRESGGARCTADAEGEHKHRYNREEIPWNTEDWE